MSEHLIWAFVLNDKVMNITRCQEGYEMANHLARACYGDNAFAVQVNQWACNIGDIYRDNCFYYIDSEVNMELPCERILTEAEKISTLMLENAELREMISPSIDVETCTLDELKSWQIKIMKNDLVSYLESHPLISKCHGNKIGTYSITEEKRNMFTSKFTGHMALATAGIEDSMTWNETGRPCETWTDEECLQLIFEWNSISTPLVKYQQSKETEIMNAGQKEEVMIIKWDYAEADPRVTLNE